MYICKDYSYDLIDIDYDKYSDMCFKIIIDSCFFILNQVNLFCQFGTRLE